MEESSDHLLCFCDGGGLRVLGLTGGAEPRTGKRRLLFSLSSVVPLWELFPIIIGHRFPTGLAILILPRWDHLTHAEPISGLCREFGIRTKRLQLRLAGFTSRGQELLTAVLSTTG